MVLKSWVLEISKTSTNFCVFDTPMKSKLLNETWKLLGCKEYICQECKIICVNGADYWQHRKLAHADLITLRFLISVLHILFFFITFFHLHVFLPTRMKKKCTYINEKKCPCSTLIRPFRLLHISSTAHCEKCPNPSVTWIVFCIKFTLLISNRKMPRVKKDDKAGNHEFLEEYQSDFRLEEQMLRPITLINAAVLKDHVRMYSSKVETMWKFSSGLSHFSTSENLTIWFF